MLLLVTIGLVVIAAVALVIGFLSDEVAWIYVSIVCSAIAGLVLYLFSRMSRRKVSPVSSTGPAPLPSPTPGPSGAGPVVEPVAPFEGVTVIEPAAEVAEEQAAPAEQPSYGAWRGDSPPVTDDAVLVPDEPAQESQEPPEETTPPPPSLADIAEAIHAVPVEESPEAIAAVTEPEPEPDTTPEIERQPTAGLEPVQDTATAPAVTQPAPTSAGFPIDDYDALRVSEIIPILGRLSPEQLEQVRAKERSDRARGTILNRIDALAGRGAAPSEAAAPTARKAAPSRKQGDKVLAKKAPTKAATAKEAPAKQTPAKQTPAKKAAAAAKTPAKKAAATTKKAAPAKGAATKAAASGSAAKKSAAKKTVAKKATGPTKK